MDILKEPTLVLNSGWVPITTVTVQDAITMLFGDYRDKLGRKLPKARVLDHETWTAHGWETDHLAIGWRHLAPKEGEPCIHAGCGQKFRVPEIIIVSRYQKIPTNQLNFNRPNLFKRDGYICQYCGLYGDSVDHVTPRAKGGKSTWTNCVVCCFACNQKKKDHTLDEVDMKLLRQPCKPGLEILGVHRARKKSWEKFLKGDQ